MWSSGAPGRGIVRNILHLTPSLSPGVIFLQGYKAQQSSVAGRRHAWEMMPSSPDSTVRHFFFHAQTETEKKRWAVYLLFITSSNFSSIHFSGGWRLWSIQSTDGCDSLNQQDVKNYYIKLNLFYFLNDYVLENISWKRIKMFLSTFYSQILMSL